MGQNAVLVVGQVLLLLWGARLVDFEDPAMLWNLRLGYCMSVGFTFALFTRVYARLTQLVAERGHLDVKRWFAVEKTLFEAAPKVVHRTELEHELSEFWNRLGQLAMQIGIVMFLHLYLGSAEAVLIQGAMNVTECLSHTLVKKYVFGIQYDNAWEATDEKPDGAVEVFANEEAAQAAQAALAVEGEGDTSGSAPAAADPVATPEELQGAQHVHPLPAGVSAETRARLDQLVLDAWDHNPDSEAAAICSDVQAFLDAAAAAGAGLGADGDAAAAACVNYRTAEGWSMLMVACGQARTAKVQAMVTALIAAKAEPTTRDGDGETCLDWAVNHRNLDAVQSLVECLHQQSEDAATAAAVAAGGHSSDDSAEAGAANAAADAERAGCIATSLGVARARLAKARGDAAAATSGGVADDAVTELQQRAAQLEQIVAFLEEQPQAQVGEAGSAAAGAGGETKLEDCD